VGVTFVQKSEGLSLETGEIDLGIDNRKIGEVNLRKGRNRLGEKTSLGAKPVKRGEPPAKNQNVQTRRSAWRQGVFKYKSPTPAWKLFGGGDGTLPSRKKGKNLEELISLYIC